MDVSFLEQSEFDSVAAVKKLRQDFERRLQALAIEPLPLNEPIVLAELPKIPQIFPEISATKPAAKAKVIVVRTIRPKIRQHKAAYRGKPAATFGNLSIPVPKPSFLRFLSFSNHTLTLAGITGLVFAVLCLTRGWHSDLSLGYPVCASGLALIVTGVTGRFFAR